MIWSNHPGDRFRQDVSHPRSTILMRTSAVLLTCTLAVTLVPADAGRAAAPKFYRDDPITRDPETQDASGAQPIGISGQFDVLENSFLNAGDRTPTRAMNVNTIDEVPDSSWFTNRAGTAGWSPADAAKGPDRGAGPAAGGWTIVSGKFEGITPGLTIRDGAGDTYFIKFDPPAHPEMASAAEVVSTKFFHAFGYYVPENYLATVRPEALTIGAGALVEDETGRKREMRPGDVDAVLAEAARNADGTYRIVASKELPGTSLGHFRYYGTRPDDPNDIFPHEHRRELRGLSVFAAWLNHDEWRSGNSLDTLVREGSRSIIRHHLLDFGSTLGSASTKAQSRRAGNEYIWEARPTIVTMLTLGLYVRPWVKVDYPEIPAIGRFEANYFLPQAWKPDYPNPAFRATRPDDRFWAARIVAAFTDESVRSIVATARFSDPRATQYLVETLLARKSKILMAWLNGTNPIVNPLLSAPGVLTFENAAEQAGVAKAAERYTVNWSRFDNATGTHQPVGDETTVTERRAQAPASLLATNPEFVAARLRAFHPDRPEWAQPLMVYFRRGDGGWTLVGLERNQ
jgi:hypothetical protein